MDEVGGITTGRVQRREWQSYYGFKRGGQRGVGEIAGISPDPTVSASRTRDAKEPLDVEFIQDKRVTWRQSEALLLALCVSLVSPRYSGPRRSAGAANRMYATLASGRRRDEAP